MTINEAIEIVTDESKSLDPIASKNHIDALKLLIEAGKRHQERRQRFPILPHLLLPGETED